MFIPIEFVPVMERLEPPQSLGHGWFSFKSIESFIIQPSERRIVSTGFILNCAHHESFLVDTPIELASKGVVIIWHNLNKRPLGNGEEITFILQNLNLPNFNPDPMAIFGDKNKLQISVKQEIARIKKL